MHQVSVSPADLPEIREIAAGKLAHIGFFVLIPDFFQHIPDHIKDMHRRRAGEPAPEIK